MDTCILTRFVHMSATELFRRECIGIVVMASPRTKGQGERFFKFISHDFIHSLLYTLYY